MPFGDEDETGEIKPAPVPATENPSASRRRSAHNSVSIDDLSPTCVSRCRRRLASGVARALGPARQRLGRKRPVLARCGNPSLRGSLEPVS